MTENDGLIWDESLEISQIDCDRFLGESEAVREAKQRLLQGLLVDPKLLNGQAALGGTAHLTESRKTHPLFKRR